MLLSILLFIVLEVSKLGCTALQITAEYLVYKLRYSYFQCNGRHFGYSTSSLVEKYSQQFRWIARP